MICLSSFLEIFGNIWKHFCLSQLEKCDCLWWAKARDAAKYPPMPRTAPKTKNYLAQGVNSVEFENPDLQCFPN